MSLPNHMDMAELMNKIKMNIGDIPNSRECNYKAESNYKCIWEHTQNKKYNINVDTYTERLARSDIQNS